MELKGFLQSISRGWLIQVTCDGFLCGRASPWAPKKDADALGPCRGCFMLLEGMGELDFCTPPKKKQVKLCDPNFFECVLLLWFSIVLFLLLYFINLHSTSKLEYSNLWLLFFDIHLLLTKCILKFPYPFFAAPIVPTKKTFSRSWLLKFSKQGSPEN